eukprot:SAG22_NODE_15_length_32914_cov_20.713546_11_plen_596_part_00
MCRIYSRKVFYLYNESNDALVKTRMAFRPGLVDLPADQQTAQYNSITLPESAVGDDLDLPPIPTQMSLEDNLDDATQDGDELEAARKDSWQPPNLSFNARKQDITLDDEDGSLNQFGGPGLEDQELLGSSGGGGGGGMNESDWFLPGGQGNGDGASLANESGGGGAGGGGDTEGEIEAPRKDSESGSAAFDFDGVTFDTYEDDGAAVKDQAARESDAKRPDGADAEEDPLASASAPSPIEGVSENDITFDDANLTMDSRASVQFSPVEEEPTAAAAAASRSVRLPKSKGKRRRVQFDEVTELTANVIKDQLKNTTDIVRQFQPAPSTRKELLDREQTGTAEMLKRPFGASRLAPQLLKAYEDMVPEFLVESDSAAEEEEEEEESSAKRSRRSSQGSLAEGAGAAAAAADSTMSSFGDDGLQGPDDSHSSIFDAGQADLDFGRNDDQAAAAMEDASQFDMSHGGEGEGNDGQQIFEEVGDTTASGSTGEAALSSASASERAGVESKSGWSKRTVKMLHALSGQFEAAGGDEAEPLDFLEMLNTSSSRKTAAATFFELLVLKSANYIDVVQSNPFETIAISRTEHFSTGQRTVSASA